MLSTVIKAFRKKLIDSYRVCIKKYSRILICPYAHVFFLWQNKISFSMWFSWLDLCTCDYIACVHIYIAFERHMAACMYN